jgi:hypothetical protein
MTPFDSYEISPCTRTENDAKPGQFYFETCEPAEADVWTLYGHIPGEGVMAIGDFDSREHAEEAFQRITGIPFAETGVIQDRVRVMHAGPRLLEALKDAREWIVSGEVDGVAFDELSVIDVIDEVMAAAEGRAA